MGEDRGIGQKAAAAGGWGGGGCQSTMLDSDHSVLWSFHWTPSGINIGPSSSMMMENKLQLTVDDRREKQHV